MLLGSLQESLLALLAYNEQHAQRIRNTVDIALFGGPYRYIAARTYDYLDRYKKPPGQHLSDLLSDKLEGKDEAEAGLCKDILRSLKETYQGINPEHVMNRLETFIKR